MKDVIGELSTQLTPWAAEELKALCEESEPVKIPFGRGRPLEGMKLAKRTCGLYVVTDLGRRVSKRRRANDTIDALQRNGDGASIAPAASAMTDDQMIEIESFALTRKWTIGRPDHFWALLAETKRARFVEEAWQMKALEVVEDAKKQLAIVAASAPIGWLLAFDAPTILAGMASASLGFLALDCYRIHKIFNS